MPEKRKRVRWQGWQEYMKKLCSARFAGALILMVALVCSIASGIDRLMLDTGEWITPWMAPHFFDNKYFMTFYGFIVCYLFSDVPFMNRSELYSIMRKGRLVWCMEKLFAITLQAFSFCALTILTSVLVFVPRLQFELKWGKIIHTLAFSRNLHQYDIIGNPSLAILLKYTPLQAMVLCFVLVGFVSGMMGILMFAISLYGSRIAAVAVSVALTGLNLAEGMFISTPWLPYITPFNWCRMGLHGESVFMDIRYYPSVQCCFLLCGAVIIFSVVSIMFRVKRMEFIWNQEE